MKHLVPLLFLPLFSLLLSNCGGGEAGIIEPGNTAPSVTVEEQAVRDGIDVEINYVLFDEEGDGVSVEVLYSLDGLEYLTATPSSSSEGTQNLEASSTGVKHIFTWDAISDLGEVFCTDTFISITPQDIHGNRGSTAVGSFEACNIALSGRIEAPYGAGLPEEARISLFNIFFGMEVTEEEWLTAGVSLTGEDDGYEIFLEEEPPVEHFIQLGDIHAAFYFPVMYLDSGDGRFDEGEDAPIGVTPLEFLVYLEEDPSGNPDLEGAEQGYNGMRFLSIGEEELEYEFFPFEEGLKVWLGGLKVGEIEATLEVIVPAGDSLPDNPRAGFIWIETGSSFPDIDELVSSEVVDNGTGTIPVTVLLPEEPPDEHLVQDEEGDLYALEFPVLYDDSDESGDASSLLEIYFGGTSYNETEGTLTVLEYLPESYLEDSESIFETLGFLALIEANIGWCIVVLDPVNEELIGTIPLNEAVTVTKGAFPPD